MTLVATLAEFKTHLNRGDTTDDTELTFFLTAASQWVEYAIGGPLSSQSFTERHWVASGTIVPRKRPILSVTSITPDQGVAIDSSMYFINTDIGTIEFRYGQLQTWHTLVYAAGLSAVTERQKLAGLEVARHLWLVQNGSSGRGFPPDEMVPTPLGFAVPRRAAELLTPDSIPGIG